MPRWLKTTLFIAGLLLALPGLPMLIGFCCVTPVMALNNDRDAVSVGLISLTSVMLTVGVGVAVAWHSWRSLQDKPSRPLRLAPAWLLTALLGLIIAAGIFVSESKIAPGLFFPPVLLIAAALPPMLAISWFTSQQAEELTWRRGLVAFSGGATASVAVAIILETLIPAIIFALVFRLGDVVMRHMQTLLAALAGKDIASTITNPGFVYVFVQIAVIAPLAEEFAKPLAVLPVLRRLARRDAFLVGAMAGAGFAALENVIYAGFGYYFWAGILVVRALGSAVHPLGAGLVSLAWRDILHGEPRAWPNGAMRFGMAAGMHALWNGGSLLVIALAGAQFFGRLPPRINVLGISAAGTTLAFLIVLGLAALWLGRMMTQRTAVPGALIGESADAQFTLSDRAVAIWALACLVAVVPAGITSLQLLVR